MGRTRAAASLWMISSAIATRNSRKIDIDRHFIQHLKMCLQLAWPYISLTNDDYKKEFSVGWSNFGLIYHEQGRYNEAESMWKWALAGAEEKLGPEHLITIRVVNSFAMVYYDRGQFEKAETMWSRVLAKIRKRARARTSLHA